ncbi:hypothetical protein L218DRAFT_143966 [Marasmius fiardii PR-910]|nr:hypothetical protein L218DRAFT_143966 [Marasmius fiardii PR-910]
MFVQCILSLFIICIFSLVFLIASSSLPLPPPLAIDYSHATFASSLLNSVARVHLNTTSLIIISSFFFFFCATSCEDFLLEKKPPMDLINNSILPTMLGPSLLWHAPRTHYIPLYRSHFNKSTTLIKIQSLVPLSRSFSSFVFDPVLFTFVVTLFFVY